MKNERFEKEDEFPKGDCGGLPWGMCGGWSNGFGCGDRPL